MMFNGFCQLQWREVNLWVEAVSDSDSLLYFILLIWVDCGFRGFAERWVDINVSLPVDFSASTEDVWRMIFSLLSLMWRNETLQTLI